jgi:hypothetical protein
MALPTTSTCQRRPVFMLHAGLELSRNRLDVCLLSDEPVIDRLLARERKGAAGHVPLDRGVVKRKRGVVVSFREALV